MVNSLHHQSVKDVAPGLHVTAHSPDGVVEGLESPDGMIVAVQCHPEELLGQEGWAMDRSSAASSSVSPTTSATATP